MKPNVIPAAEAARRKGCTTQAVYNAIARGDLTGLRIGRARMVVLDSRFDAYSVQETGGRLHVSFRGKHGAPESAVQEG